MTNKFSLLNNSEVRRRIAVMLLAVLLILFAQSIQPSAAKYISLITGQAGTVAAKPVVVVESDNYISFADNVNGYLEFSVSNFETVEGETIVNETTMTYIIEVIVPTANEVTAGKLYLCTAGYPSTDIVDENVKFATSTRQETRTVEGVACNVFVYESSTMAELVASHTTATTYYWLVELSPTLENIGIFSAHVNVIATQVD